MTILTNGNFDRVIELDAGLITAIARATLAVAANPERVKEEYFTAEVTAQSRIEAIWFRVRPAGWANKSGFGQLTRNTDDRVTIALEMTVQIDFRSLLLPMPGGPVVVDLTTGIADAILSDEARRLAFGAYVEATDRAEVRTLTVRTDREVRDLTVRVPCVVLDFRPDIDGLALPMVEVRVQRESLRSAPAVMALMTAAELLSPGGGEAALDSLVTTLNENLAASVAYTLARLTDWRLEDPQWGTGTVILFFERPKEGAPLTGMGVKTLDRSLMIGLDYLGQIGNSARMQTTTLGLGEALSVNISNRQLLRSQVRPAFEEQFGLQNPNLWRADEYCALAGPVADRVIAGQTVTITDLFAFVGTMSEVRVNLSINTDVAPGVTLYATFALEIGFRVARDVAGGSQIFRITPFLLNPNTALTSPPRVELAWWVWLAGIVIAGLVGAVIVAIIDGIIEVIAGNQLRSAMGSMGLDETNSLADLPVTLTNPRLTLNEPGAPAMPTPLGNVLYSFFGLGGAHDLRIGASFNQLPDPLFVSCQIPNSSDLGARLDGIGGDLPEGGRWRLMLDDAISLVEAGRTLIVRAPDGRDVEVTVERTSSGVPYLRTQSDDLGGNNLSNLPPCLG